MRARKCGGSRGGSTKKNVLITVHCVNDLGWNKFQLLLINAGL